jgi:3-oxoacyl-[acyl-carrier protein] reductase
MIFGAATLSKKILIIGGSGGIGQAIAPILKERGYEVSTYSSADLDITNEMDVNLVLHNAAPHVLIDLAAVSFDNVIAKTSNENVRKQLEVNVMGNINLVRSFTSICKVMKTPGRYIYMSSILAETPVMGAGVYSASKAFNEHLLEVAAKENAKYGITYNSIRLGYFAVGLCARLTQQIRESVLNDIPLKRFGRPEELVNLIEFFINTEYVTGSTVKLAGGL